MLILKSHYDLIQLDIFNKDKMTELLFQKECHSAYFFYLNMRGGHFKWEPKTTMKQ
jgi:hypothetical protein